ncbi:ammonium transporter Rh type B-B [Hyposmocoma kahamanoa]|uniref:ammonium transporter Rh type B-B n=1 Tax=Hyposmocoma kahamanoa TaxID=1477025 RepID=UPI000E6D9713|nr:ammonium transporter Rh type B-B [Hyposmocoma kahamanoa]
MPSASNTPSRESLADPDLSMDSPEFEISCMERTRFEGTHVMIFIGFGFLMTFLKKYCYSALGLNLLLASLVIQWAILCQNIFEMESGVIVITKHSLLEADIMSATVLITFGALLGFASSTQLLFLAVIETVIGCTNLWLVTHVLRAADVGGSIAIHAFGAYFGLGVSFAYRDKKSTTEAATESISTAMPSLNGPKYTSDVTAMIGTIFLWIYWPSFNSGLTESDAEYTRAVVNTYLSLAAATVTSFVISSLVSHAKFDMVHVQNSTLAGGVAVGSICNLHIGAGGALAVGIGAGILSVLGYHYLTPKIAKHCGVLDTCGVNNLHGMPGIYSGILSIIFAMLAREDTYGKELGTIFPAMVGDHPRSANVQGLYQFAALVITIVLAFVGGAIAGYLSKIPKAFKKLNDDEKYNDEVDWELPADV